MKNKIDSITIFMTDSCNMRCKYCFENKNGYKNNFISEKHIDKCLKFFKNNENPINLNLFGGEPTLNFKGIKCIFDKIKEYDILVEEINITTNFLKLNKNLMKLLNDSKYNVTITISCILNQEEHDKERVDINNKGTFDSINKNLLFSLENYKNIRYTTHSVISRNNIKNISKIIDSTLEFKHKYPEVKNTFALVSVGSSKTGADEYTKEELNYYYKDYVTRKNLNQFCDCVISEIYFPIIRSIDYLTNDKIGVCRVFKTEMTLLTDGRIVPCHRVIENPNEEFFNIDEINDLQEIQEKFTIPENLQDDNVKLYSEIDNYDCSKCAFNSSCHTCVIGNKNEINSYLFKSKKECNRTMTVAELTIEYEKVKLMKEQNEQLKTLNEKIDKLGNLNVNIAEAIQILLEINKK